MGDQQLHDVRAVALAYGAGGEHVALIKSLLAEGLPAENIVVVHNPSRPDEPAPPVPDGCELLRASHNLGYAAGMNLGIRRELGRDCAFILVLTHDAALHPGALGALLEAARRHPEYGVLGPALVFADSGAPFSFGGVTEDDGTMRHLEALPSGEPNGGEHRIFDCDWIDGGTMLVRAELLERLGGFEERFWSYYEDADLCLRARRAGYRVGTLLGAKADQAPGGLKRPGPWAYLMTRNGLAFAHRAKGLRGLALTAWRAVWQSFLNVLRTAARLAGLRERPASESWALAVGAVRGLLDFARGRWGPPPPLPGGGDLRNTRPPEPEAAGAAQTNQGAPSVSE